MLDAHAKPAARIAISASQPPSVSSAGTMHTSLPTRTVQRVAPRDTMVKVSKAWEIPARNAPKTATNVMGSSYAQNVQIRHSSRRTSSARVNVRQASFRLEIQSVDAFVKSCAFGVGETEVQRMTRGIALSADPDVNVNMGDRKSVV